MTASGLKFVVEEAKVLQAKAFFQCTMFQQYTTSEEEETIFRVNLDVFLVCHASLEFFRSNSELFFRRNASASSAAAHSPLWK